MLSLKKTSLINIFQDSGQFFKALRWPEGKKECIRCNSDVIYTLKTGRLRCKLCGLTFGDFTGTYLGQLNIPINEIAHLLYLFALGLPVYRCRHYITISMKTAHRAYTLFRRALYDHSVPVFNEVLGENPKLNTWIHKNFTLDFMKTWDADKRNVYFGCIVIQNAVCTFPIKINEMPKIYDSLPRDLKQTRLLSIDQKYWIGVMPVNGTHLLLPKYTPRFKNGKPNAKIDSFWTYLNQQLYNYHGISITHYHLYIKEIEFRYNNRTSGLFHPIAKMIVQPVPKSSMSNLNDTLT